MSAESYYPAGAYYDKRAPYNEPIYPVYPKDDDEPEYEPDYDEMAYERMMEEEND